MAVVLSPPLRMAGAGLASRVCGCASSLQVLWPGAAQGPGGFPTLRTRAAEGTEDFVHKARVCRLGLRLSANGGLQLLAQRQCPDLADRSAR